MKFLNNLTSNQPTTLHDQITSLHALIAVKAMRLNVFACGSESMSTTSSEEEATVEQKTQLIETDLRNVSIHAFVF